MLQESFYTWSGRPFVPLQVQMRPNVLMRERCQLVRLTAELNTLLFTSATPRPSADFSRTGLNLKNRMRTWYTGLPSDLAFQASLPAPLYELQ